jgi:hypothetical protein
MQSGGKPPHSKMDSAWTLGANAQDQVVGSTENATPKQRQRLPGSMNLNRPLQIQRQ